ncbi:MAG: hypothetical protein PVG70_06645, partial [Desulfobacterales bacterium]
MRYAKITKFGMAGSTGVAPAYVSLEPTRSHHDPPPSIHNVILVPDLFSLSLRSGDVHHGQKIFKRRAGCHR